MIWLKLWLKFGMEIHCTLKRETKLIENQSSDPISKNLKYKLTDFSNKTTMSRFKNIFYCENCKS